MVCPRDIDCSSQPCRAEMDVICGLISAQPFIRRPFPHTLVH
jgi:hypothetical protein